MEKQTNYSKQRVDFAAALEADRAAAAGQERTAAAPDATMRAVLVSGLDKFLEAASAREKNALVTFFCAYENSRGEDGKRNMLLALDRATDDLAQISKITRSMLDAAWTALDVADGMTPVEDYLESLLMTYSIRGTITPAEVREETEKFFSDFAAMRDAVKYFVKQNPDVLAEETAA